MTLRRVSRSRVAARRVESTMSQNITVKWRVVRRRPAAAPAPQQCRRSLACRARRWPHATSCGRRAEARALADRHRSGSAIPPRQSSRCERALCVPPTLSAAAKSLCRLQIPPQIYLWTSAYSQPSSDILKGFKVLPVLPIRYERLKTSDFVTADRDIMIDELVTQRFPKHRRYRQRVHGFVQAARHGRPLRLRIRIRQRAAGIDLVGDAV